MCIIYFYDEQLVDTLDLRSDEYILTGWMVEMFFSLFVFFLSIFYFIILIGNDV